MPVGILLHSRQYVGLSQISQAVPSNNWELRLSRNNRKWAYVVCIFSYISFVYVHVCVCLHMLRKVCWILPIISRFYATSFNMTRHDYQCWFISDACTALTCIVDEASQLSRQPLSTDLSTIHKNQQFLHGEGLCPRYINPANYTCFTFIVVIYTLI